MVKFKIIVFNPLKDTYTLEEKINEWLKDNPNICIQNVNVVRDSGNVFVPTNVLIFYEEKENNNE